MIQELHRVISLIEGEWSKVRVLIVGDIMLDCYIWGDVERVSPEAPVPVVRSIHRTEQPGGAANVAMNLTGLGARASLFGFCGEDSNRDLLMNRLQTAGIDAELTPVASHPTTTKLRIVGGKQQMLRLDTEKTDGYPAEAYERMLDGIERALPGAGAVVLSDYAKGVLTEDVCRRVIAMARRQGIPVLVDPKQRDFSRYLGATTVCPNLSELSVATGVAARQLQEILRAGQGMVSQLDLAYLTVTLSEKGIAVLRSDEQQVFPAQARQVFDVSGAGDTVIATLALALASGLEVETAAQLANVAAGIVVSKVGTVPVDRDELLTSLTPEIGLHAEEKVLPLERLKTRVSAWRSAGEQVVFTNGCFDLLHIGHVTLLEDARREGDRLVVAINSDASVSGLKGPTRPIVGERERGRILAALAAVDAVVVFDDPTPLRLIEALQPDVIVKGGDYDESTIVGAKEVRSWGGRVKIIPIVEGFSTTKLIAKATAPA
ncbi:bifunctional D-glycero-beta-D-manno-heptose-7-phosphate kinase/D-glycero-beta-D-manno-heptose 1-phosphate adenylyltransferase HldE [Paracidobacterium acidisoli]|uniref:Bifunctional protein HldE n=1 Tax=Paracidobacterium acidisoli TaxID=2303751 RepID=A0A372IRK5_9BACT|nr:bifunctional D-glycero-beta-D-manno-heptose-7-phosphate kinase/D-glycero-beta-D-manno-heptose 1-phosphate adenylyltransferase HldE [Paracidobacterium acidisoli]MBT9330425.1 bifunctional D-glycero-beta-D-manno-heptose-7-phosphate kinase/D-glycero-beta-D-manno-heptose 1-phosphate adenylyltransferase HldE [Paracidobacterium acidisoli]